MAYTYLCIDLLAVIVCFLFSFDRRIRFYPYFGIVLKSMLLVALPFIAWDAWFTARGVWWFREQYTLGMSMLGLPVEEWLFFICIPFSCLFTFFCLDRFVNLDWTAKYQPAVVWILLGLLTVTIALHLERLYPLVTGLFTVAVLVFLHFIAKVTWLAKATLTYILLMPGFFLVNGVLTGTGLRAPIVNYNPAEIMNVRILTIPVEDMVYGYALILLNLYFFLLFRKRRERSFVINY
ncbi:MAG TPA: lycopene cyclase domain-containing protein [Puia sp.]|uniref:lycopene cyclase domain-containing protein n=1 Tax=Puia sp. TaxID=2045100 RepID=UPI002CD4A32A|nr:lycopene cyclase domain-containing protein [Puia sp.]HVU98704.1 lycopene cyclase domain-containing protein [Puia sp.]